MTMGSTVRGNGMEAGRHQGRIARYRFVTEEKAGGATYTPKGLADFVANQIADAAPIEKLRVPFRVLDPAVGDGELLLSLLNQLTRRGHSRIEVNGFDTREQAISATSFRLKERFPALSVNLERGDFLDFVVRRFGGGRNGELFRPSLPDSYDLIIANPPYVRTQIMGAEQAGILAQQFELTGRVDLYYAFLIAMARVLRPKGVAGVIVSNRFMTTKSGAAVRRAIREQFNVRHIWDLGDTKLFEAAVLPAVLLLEGKQGKQMSTPTFTSMYETDAQADLEAVSPVDALGHTGVVGTSDGRHFLVRHGQLDTTGGLNAVWRIDTAETNTWLTTVKRHTWKTFRSIGKIRVGVKTCADRIFIRTDWEEVPEKERPELLKPLMTHHVARRFRASESKEMRYIVYPHETVLGERKAVDLERYPRMKAYLERHRVALEARRYVTESGRKWYEIWVPQDPSVWSRPKLVFRDISEEPMFWIDQTGAVVNGDCYWMVCEHASEPDLLWLLAAIGNSTFIEAFYDHRFHNKLYAGRRRFMTQYVEEFPVPDPKSPTSKKIISKAKRLYDNMGSRSDDLIAREVDDLVWQAFGLSREKVSG